MHHQKIAVFSKQVIITEKWSNIPLYYTSYLNFTIWYSLESFVSSTSSNHLVLALALALDPDETPT
uniref:Putative ovule protein n=1 Tax=Solanum chacoense TaxID=4108 RepID=A0A0V0IJI6_SOLCH